MELLYTSYLEISDCGDVKMIIRDDKQEFEFITGVKDVVLPSFFSNLTSFIKGEIHSFSVDGYDTMTQYKFSRNGNRINILFKKRHTLKDYEFNVELFMKAIQKAFKAYFRQQRLGGNVEDNDSILSEWNEFNQEI
jgi:DNA-dependent RNA polymerase auxiliary subunit epsilon